jgi:hypothetical protein
MAKVAVGGTNGLIDRLLTLVGWQASANPSDPQRIDCLNALNFAESYIAQSEALKYLDVRTTISANAAAVAVPTNPAIDFGKDYVLETSDGLARIEVVPPDEFAARGSETFDRIVSKAAVAMLAVDASDATLKWFFKPTPSAETIPLTYQRVPAALTDSGGSTSLLPEGYELTLLLMIAEAYVKRRRNSLESDFLDASTRALLDQFYDKQRTSKLKPMTDKSRERRKVDEEALAPGR